MRNPALTQALSIALAVLCLTTAFAGALGLRSAANERRGELAAVERLRERAAAYRTIADSVEGTVSYAEQSEALEEREAQHSKDSSQHRSELGIFTATKYGLNTGTDAIDEADRAFADVRARFESALPAVERGLAELDGVIAPVRKLYDTAASVVQSAEAHLSAASGFAAVLDGGETLTSAQAVAAYDELLSIADEAVAMRETLRELRPALDALAAFDPTAVTDMTDALSSLTSSLGAFGSVPVDNYLDFDVTVPFEMGNLAEMQQSFSAYWTEAQGLLDALDAAEPALAEAVEQATGLSMEALREEAQQQRDALAARGDEPLDAAESEAIRSVYDANSEAIHTGLDEATAALANVKGSLAELGGTLTAAETMLPTFHTMLDTAKKGIQEGADALYQARALIWWQMGQQRDKEAALTEEKAALDEEAEELRALSDEAAEQKELESRLRSARAALMNRDEVRALAVDGVEPDEAALLYAAQRESGALTQYTQRQRACLLMLLAALGRLLALPGAFSVKRARLRLLPPLLLCLAGAVLAEWQFRTMGRGDSYSCIATALFALLQLIVSLPGAKKGQKT